MHYTFVHVHVNTRYTVSWLWSHHYILYVIIHSTCTMVPPVQESSDVIISQSRIKQKLKEMTSRSEVILHLMSWLPVVHNEMEWPGYL